MSKVALLALLLSPAWLTSQNAIASSESETQLTQTQQRIGQVPGTRRVNSVDDFSDVPPGHWARTALDDLIRDYGCIAGYPDGTYRGNRTLTRYEFAAALDACVDAILTGTGTPEGIPVGRLEQIERLQEEFAAELATLRGRVDSLEERVQFLEDHQFSTTTRLAGEVIFALSDSFGGDEDETQTVFQQRVRLNLLTSFDGDDLLVTRLQAGNGDRFNIENENDGLPIGQTAEGLQTFQIGDSDSDVVLTNLEYYFPIGDLEVMIAANGSSFDRFIDTLNPYFEDRDGGSGTLSAFGQRNPIYRLGGGAGIGLNYDLGDLEISAGYLTGEANDPDIGDGLFNGDYAALGQIAFRPSDSFGIAFTYNHAYFGEDNFAFDKGGQGLGQTGTALANGFSATNPIDSDSFGLQFALGLGDSLQINGWAGYTNVELRDDDVSGDIWNGALAIGLPDLGSEGSLAGLVVGIQPFLTELEGFDDFFEDDIPLHVEGFYKYQLNDNISVTPGVIWLVNPNQDSDNDDAFIGTLRTTFTF